MGSQKHCKVPLGRLRRLLRLGCFPHWAPSAKPAYPSAPQIKQGVSGSTWNHFFGFLVHVCVWRSVACLRLGGNLKVIVMIHGLKLQKLMSVAGLSKSCCSICCRSLFGRVHRAHQVCIHYFSYWPRLSLAYLASVIS